MSTSWENRRSSWQSVSATTPPTKVIGLSVDPVESHERWIGDIEEVNDVKMNYPLIGDPDHSIAELYDMLPIPSS